MVFNFYYCIHFPKLKYEHFRMITENNPSVHRIHYQPIIPHIEDWPIARLFQDKQKIITEVTQGTYHELTKGKAERDIIDMIARTMYLERVRMAENPWKVDPKDEGKFWARIKKDLVKLEHLSEPQDSSQEEVAKILNRIIKRYTEEITSTFRPSSYHFAKRVLPFAFSTLLNASAGKTIKSFIYHRYHLLDKVHLVGETDFIRNLAQKGTVVLVPTHLSNVDSILVAWGLHALGLPAFIYGAGLNLYNSRIFAYFMQRLGAYKIDRRKKNPIYQQNLKSYVINATTQGVHGVFFPGGTRSRSGMIEKRLKLGIMGTTIESQRRLLLERQEQDGKIFIFPMVMSYHFVLEAASLINQHLKRTGQEHYYVMNDEFSSWNKFFKFVWTSFSNTSEISLAFGKPMDVFGNFVDEEGRSFDERGNLINIRDYFCMKGKMTEDPQRDGEYTKILGERMVERYHIENRVFSSHIVAFVAFEMLKNKFKSFDLYSLLRIPVEERTLNEAAYRMTVGRVLQRLRDLADCGKVHLAGHIVFDLDALITHGIRNLGIYHSKRPLSLPRDGHITAENMNLLYYYRNRLAGYELERYV